MARCAGARADEPGEDLMTDVIDRLVSQHDYCAVCANSLLQYVGSLLNR